MISNTSITLYNKVTIKDEVTWYKTHIHNVNWQDKNVLVPTEKTLYSITQIFVPFEAVRRAGKDYIGSVAFRKENDRDNLITFTESDLIVKGVCEYDLNTGSEKDLRSTVDNVLSIIAVSVNNNGSPRMQHFEVEAK